jgi:MFS transporter, DHA2 family, multidrug resistance protein
MNEISVDAAAALPSGRWQATAGLMLVTLMPAFDATIANVALPRLQANLGGGLEFGAWVMTSYLCATAVVAPLTGWGRRRFGARHLFEAATGIFVLASLWCALAVAPAMMICGRLIQGAAGGIIQPLAQSIILDIHPKEKHGRMLTVWSIAVMTGPVLGPLLGGIITDLASWRGIFAVNLPLVIVAAPGLRHVPQNPGENGRVETRLRDFALLAVAVGALQLALQRSTDHAWSRAPELVGEALVAVAAASLIALTARRSGFALLRFAIFRDRNFAAAAFCSFAASAMLFTTIVFVPALAQGPLGYDATIAGMAMAPRGIATIATMLAILPVIDRVDKRLLVGLGMMIISGGFALVTATENGHGAAWLAAASTVQGLGCGLFFTPLATLAYSTLAARLRGDAAGTWWLARQLGSAAGVAVMTAVLEARMPSDIAHAGAVATAASAARVAVIASYASAFRTMAAVMLVLLPIVFLFRKTHRVTTA